MNALALLLRRAASWLPRLFAALLLAALAGEIAWLIWVGPIIPAPGPAETLLTTPLRPPPALPAPVPIDPPAEKRPPAMAPDDLARLERMLAAASSLPPRRTRKALPAPDHAPAPLASMTPLATFRDCAACPLMVLLPAGRFNMGSASGNAWERPRHAVRIARPFALARFETSEKQWRACADDGYCGTGSGSALLPVAKVSWQDARDYVEWLRARTGRRYRLPTEAEWAYAMRAGTSSSRHWGADRSGQCLHANGADRALLRAQRTGTRHADCDDRHARRAPVGSFRPNRFGLHDMAGNVWEWVEDCWTGNFRNAPGDGSAVLRSHCEERVIRGGSWRSEPEALRSNERARALPGQRSDDLGFRVAAD